ncbi:hypothetical protein PSN45_004505 [Yamadazyma tenuis]|uniref:EKC/KEOPS complex subunit CGI121 n=1 Tax=Candida tenuis (strain ATCC 10573 / BCRC 21748 / CBS 615 / JCM 9827 / NBRC 10315 / NRRL Y-1498 / VKM Y-70) TaxID=590646 RepID=G3B5G8_CANTC|nr:uncharacterized protein CANTEDRAFT_105888 [Yamadazyma tenuis ATCC 10573]EGV63222.1 hypothetical protein CANTEDRAFT_105888 [Yamadazyma tenuis ATCC 10573]WEJ96959.1 hypothetical protein PSN45_004505 [Yamadazyma tenuis]
MVFEKVVFPSYPHKTVFISVFANVPKNVLSVVKTKLIEGDPNYELCFLNTNYIISTEYLYSAIYKAILNFETGQSKAKTLNTEIIFNLSPVNNIMDAFKRFGVDDSQDQSNVICIKVIDYVSDGNCLEDLNTHISKLLHTDASQNIPLQDAYLFKTVDISKFKKIFKLNDAKLSESENLQIQLTRLAIGACLIRGN